jgi:hypothetical protein
MSANNIHIEWLEIQYEDEEKDEDNSDEDGDASSFKINKLDSSATILNKLASEDINSTIMSFVFVKDKRHYTTLESIIWGVLTNKNIYRLSFETYEKIYYYFKDNWFDICMMYIHVIQKCKSFESNEKPQYLPYKHKTQLKIINNICKNINKLKPDEDIKQFNIKELEREYKKWVKEYLNNVKLQLETCTSLKNQQASLQEFKALEITEIKIESTTHQIKVSLKHDDTKPSIEEGIKIFDDSIVNKYVSYIQYNSLNEKYYKIYDNIEDNIVVDKSIYTHCVTKYDRPNTIYIILPPLNGKVNKKNLIEITYQIDTSIITFVSSKSYPLKTIIKKLITSLPTLNLSLPRDSHISGYFDFKHLIINDTSLYYMIMLDEIFKSYLYIDELKKSWADKNEVKIYYKNFTKNDKSSVVISFGDFTPENINLNEGNLRVKIIRAESTEILENFVLILSHLLAKYKKEKAAVETEMRFIIPGCAKYDSVGLIFQPEKSASESFTKNGKEKKKKKENDLFDNTRKKALARHTPDVYPSGTAKRIQSVFQPIPVPRDEVAEWRKYSSLNEDRLVLPFPPVQTEDGKYLNPLTIDPYDKRVKYWFVCPDDLHNYPILKDMRNLDLKIKYPFSVQCGRKNMFGDKTDPLYYHYYDDVPKAKNKSKGILTTSKILSGGGAAKVTTILDQLLNFDTSNVEVKKPIFRFGGSPSVSNNSFIHCILKAISDKTYLETDDKEKYTSSVRTFIANNISPLLLKQELYDLSDEEIKQELLDKNVIFSSEKFFRALEEIFQINIFVFTPVISDKSSNNVKDLNIEIPRCKIFHLRPERKDRPSILIYKHYGAKVNHLTYPHYELIAKINGDVVVEKSSDNKYNFVFNKEITKICYLCLIQSSTSFMWNINDDKKEITTRVNTFSKIDWVEVFTGYKIIGQRVDQYGKMRMIGVQIDSENIMTVFLPPSQPINVPYLENITRISTSLCMQKLGNPSGYSNSSEHKDSNGLWYPVIDIQYCIFVPVKGIATKIGKKKKEKEAEKVSEPSPEFSIDQYRLSDLSNPKDNKPSAIVQNNDHIGIKVEGLKLARKNIIYLTQIIRWLYRFDRCSNFATWWDEWVVSDEKVTNEVKNDCKVGVKLPVVSDTKSGIDAISPLWGKFFFDSKIHLYPILYKKLFDFFMVEFLSYHSQTPQEIKYLNRVYTFETDFIQKKHTLLFINPKQLNIWLDFQAVKNSSIIGQIVISQETNNSKLFEINPYIYQDSVTLKSYIIQNVKGGELKRVFNVCKTWRDKLVNTGFYTDPIKTEEVLSYVIYSISSSNKFIQTGDFSNDDINYFEIIKVTQSGQDRYVAMLPLN